MDAYATQHLPRLTSLRIIIPTQLPSLRTINPYAEADAERNYHPYAALVPTRSQLLRIYHAYASLIPTRSSLIVANCKVTSLPLTHHKTVSSY